MSDIVSETDLWLHTRECWQAECSYNTLHITGSNPVLTTKHVHGRHVLFGFIGGGGSPPLFNLI